MATVLDIMRSPPNLGVALRCAAMGYPVFPCHSGGEKAKAPRVKGWQEAATTDEATVRGWWAQWPDALVGLHLARAGVIAIDADRHGGPDGVAAWEALAADHRLSSACAPAVETPSGGRHVYFAAPAGMEPTNGEGTLPAGINVRWAGYTIAPGCVLPDGRRYSPIPGTPPLSLELPAATAWLIGMIGTARRAADNQQPLCELDVPDAIERARAFLAACAPAVEGQGGDGWTFKVACQLKDMGVSEGLALDLMADDWNETCDPPWAIDELATKVANAYAYSQNAAGSQSPPVDFGGLAAIEPARYVQRASRLRWLSDPGVLVQPRWLLRPLLPEVGVAVIAGQSRAGKSFVALDLARALAMGEGFFERKARERVGVLFVAAEAVGTISQRLEALRLHKLAGTDPAYLPISWADLDEVPRPSDLVERVNAVAAELHRLAEEAGAAMIERHGLRLGAIIIDTVGAAFGVPDSDDEAAKLVMGALGVLSRKSGLAVLPVAHFGKDDRSGIVGSYYWTAAADVVLSITANICERTGEVSDRRLAVTKNKLDEQGPISAFDLDRVLIGIGRDGNEETSAIVKATVELAKPERPSPHADLYRECLFNAMVDCTVEIGGRAMAKRLAVLALFKERVPGSKDSGNVSRKFASAERWAGVTVKHIDGVDYVAEDQWPGIG